MFTRTHLETLLINIMMQPSCRKPRYGRLELMHFYESEIGQVIYRWRSISVEPLMEHIKSVFRIDPWSVRGYHRAAAAAVLLSVLLYQLLVYYNCKNGKGNPKSAKYMVGAYGWTAF